MKKTAVVFIMLCQICAVSVTAQTAFIRPLPPTAVSATCNPGQVVVQFTKATGGVNDSFTDYRYQAVLVNDLSVSLQVAYQSGKGASAGAIISAETTDATQIVLPAGKPVSGYLAVSTSGIRKNTASKDRILSGWKLYTSSDGMPLRITVGTDTSLYAMAQYAGTDKSSAVAMITFAMSSAANMSFTLKKGSSSVIDIADLSTVTSSGSLLVTDDIKNAISSISSSITNVVVKKDSSGYTFFTIFALVTNPSMTEEITYNVTSVPLSKVWAEGKIAVSPDAGLENILSTTTLLTRLASASTDPVTETPGGSTPDSLSVKLLSSILFHRVIAHNSPVSDLLEEDNGIFTNYIQYFDDIVKNWDSVKGSIPGLPRLKAIYNRVLLQNSGIISDPVWAYNHGTLSEYGRPEQERKNYAFYEGYSRLHFDMEKPIYSTGTHTGAGIMFRVSDNIELYKANLADTFNMFDSAIIDGAVARRLIVKVNDSMFRNIDTAGLWVLGIIPDNIDDKSNLAWYAGITAIRLPLNGMYGTGVKIDTAFSMSDEKSAKSDANGMIVGGAGSNIFKMYALEEDPQLKEDTVYNNVEPGIFLHHQRRIIELDSNYFKSYDSLKFDIVGFDSAGKKIFVESTEGKYKATLKDTSQTEGDVQARIYLDNLFVYVAKKKVLVSKIFAEDAVNGNLSESTSKNHVIEINMVDVEKLKLCKIPELDENGTVTITMSTNSILYTDESCSSPWCSTIFHIENNTDINTNGKYVQKYVRKWKEYKNDLNGIKTLFVKFDKLGVEKIQIQLSIPSFIIAKYMHNVHYSVISNKTLSETLELSCNHRKIVLEPITNERVPGTKGEIYNPACVVSGGDANFKIEIDGAGITSDKVIWRSQNGKVKFYDRFGALQATGTGYNVKVRGNDGIDDEEDKLIVSVTNDTLLKKPEISFSVVKQVNLNVYTYIVKNTSNDSAFTKDEISRAIDTVNEIFKQIGVFVKRKDLIPDLGNDPDKDKYYIVEDLNAVDELYDMKKNTNDGIEVYFVKGQKYRFGTLANTIYDKGIYITRSGYVSTTDTIPNVFVSQILAHEILHCMRDTLSSGECVKDIYDENYGELLKPYLCYEAIPDDWDVGYYSTAHKKLNNVINKLLMYGNNSIDTKSFDIPRGKVYGNGVNGIGGIYEDPIDCGGILKLKKRVFQNGN